MAELKIVISNRAPRAMNDSTGPGVIPSVITALPGTPAPPAPGFASRMG